MPIEALLVLVIGGIAGVALLLHLTGRSNLRVLSPDGARAEWLRHFPDDTIVDVTLSHDGHAALLRTETGPGLLWSFGADTVARHLLDFDWLEHPKGMEFYFHDFATPHVLVHLDETERRHWRHLMEPA
ncbi:hypothetical protein AVO45_11540 [Ruegeria marisrubri]|uniref:Uncharacterized protein n=1 Tax=Ruegeria marisrubri TaxID=1685379 RepID=A0A0X3TL06_9RHOB|nr:hypothetical protein [Ruegeria marisrubri]KUJ76424.1 hypothetical protein AVO45_11540 [Ruegeria marisrubri]